MRMVSTILFVVALVCSLSALPQSLEQSRMKALNDASAAAAREDYAGAAGYLEIYAEGGDAVAQTRLGELYLSGGKGLPQDLAKAIALFGQAAEQGNGSGQRHLAIAYEKGQGVTADPATSLKWYLKAADRGDALAQIAIGKMYASGTRVPQDYVQAYKWFTLASSGPSTDSEKAIREEALANRTAVAVKMSPSQITNAQRLVREWVAR